MGSTGGKTGRGEGLLPATEWPPWPTEVLQGRQPPSPRPPAHKKTELVLRIMSGKNHFHQRRETVLISG